MHCILTDQQLTRTASRETLLELAAGALLGAADANTPEGLLEARRLGRLLEGYRELPPALRPTEPRSHRTRWCDVWSKLPADLRADLGSRGLNATAFATTSLPVSRPEPVLVPLFDFLCADFLRNEAEDHTPHLRGISEASTRAVELTIDAAGPSASLAVARELDGAVQSLELGPEHRRVLPLLLAAEHARLRGGQLDVWCEPDSIRLRLDLPIARGRRAISRSLEIGTRRRPAR